MSLRINKDRSNLDTLNKTLEKEDFIKGILDSLDEQDKYTISSPEDDIFYEWDSSYKNFIQDINNRIFMSNQCKCYESKD
jgi:hypothetical protein